jgi:hypothetical protein
MKSPSVTNARYTVILVQYGCPYKHLQFNLKTASASTPVYPFVKNPVIEKTMQTFCFDPGFAKRARPLRFVRCKHGPYIPIDQRAMDQLPNY